MSKIVRLSARLPSAETVQALAAQLSRVEGASSDDAATMDAIVEAERRLVGALAKARSSNIAEVEQKITAVLRRAQAADGFLTDDDLGLLRSVLMDVRQIDPALTVAKSVFDTAGNTEHALAL